MQRHLSKLTPINGGAISKELRDRLNAMQDAILALANGQNISLTGNIKRGYGAGQLSLTVGKSGPTVFGGTETIIPPLTIVSSRPAYVPVPSTPVAEGYVRFYLTWGMTQGTLADNWSNCVDVPTGAETVRYISMKAFLKPTGDAVVVTRCEWVTFTEAQKDSGLFDTPDYSADGSRPAHMFIPLGAIYVSSEGVASSLSNAGGSISIVEYVAAISFTGSAVKYKKALSSSRLNY